MVRFLCLFISGSLCTLLVALQGIHTRSCTNHTHFSLSLLVLLPYLATDVRTWIANIEQHASEGVSKILVGNKCDSDESRVITSEQAQELADELGLPYVETSAKSSTNVEDAFFTLARDIKAKRGEDSPTSSTTNTVNVTSGGNRTASQGGCCS